MKIQEKDILYEDNHLIAVNKPATILVQGDHTNDKPLVEMVRSFIKKKYDKPGNVFTGVIHRIDRPVSGLVLFAKTSKGLSRMNELFKEKKITKTYWCLTEDIPQEKEGFLEDLLYKNGKKNKSFIDKNQSKKSSLSKLKYEVISKLDNYYFLKINPITGRHHQIRAQLSHVKAYIKGDIKYGAKRSNSDGSISLHARGLEFLHPIKKTKIKILCPPPKDAIWDAVLKEFSKDQHQ